MAIIRFHDKSFDKDTVSSKEINWGGSVISWVNKNIHAGQNFEVYEGGISKEKEISRDEEKMLSAVDVDIILLPAGVIATTKSLSSSISSLIAPAQPVNTVNRTQSSPNNSLADRRNTARPNQRIVDIVGKVKSIPDVLQREYSKYKDNIEERYGYYCFCRNQVLVEDVKDGDTLISNTAGSSAGIYYPNKSPNNSSPDVQIGGLINERVWGVYQSNDAIGQTLLADNETAIPMNTNVIAYPDGHLDSSDSSINFGDTFTGFDAVILNNFKALNDSDNEIDFGEDTFSTDFASGNIIYFETAGDPTWADIKTGGTPLIIDEAVPSLTKKQNFIVGIFDVSAIKIDRLIVNVYAPNGVYKDSNDGFRESSSVSFNVSVQLLDDNLDPIGSPIIQTGEISGSDEDEKGITIEYDLGGSYYIQYALTRTTSKDFDYEGRVVDEIKLKSVFGLYETDKDHFGNVTTIQTKRTASSQVTAIKNPEVNAVVTELVYKYEDGEFASELTPNTQAMQSLIRLAMDPYVGRREVSELDLDSLISSQNECEEYFGNAEAGQCSHSFDSTKKSAQEIFFLIANAAFIHLWREGRTLKSWFESPQSIPKMVFTHRSKKSNSETWTRDFQQSKRKDSIEFKYIDSDIYTQETLYFPADRSGTNPLKVEIPGIKGLSQATWRMMREYNKLIYQNIGVRFTSTEEGRMVLPNELISVVKGSRVGTSDGYCVSVNGLSLTLSQRVSFTPDDEHYIILKRRDGTTESIPVTEGENSFIVNLGYAPDEEIYTGNDALKTEFSFGNEARLDGQLMIAQEVTPSSKSFTEIKAYNYSDNYYKDDPSVITSSAFSQDFNTGFQ